MKWIVFTLLLASTASAQTSISGRVIDPAGKPVANIEVMLHAVTQTSGAQIDRDTTDAKGAFTLTAKTADADAVYFVAVTRNGELYMGELLRPPFPANQEYVVQVGVNPVQMGGAANQPPPPQRPESNTAGIVIVLVSAVVIGSVIYLAMRKRPAARRRWLVELARLEEDMASGAADDARLQKRRAELRARLCR